MPKAGHYTVVVIGTGFGGTMTALPIAREFVRRNKGETILMLERGTWWTTPVGTVQDKEVRTYDFLSQNKQPVQFWSTPNHFSGFLDIFTRCFRHQKNQDGLYHLSFLGRAGMLGTFGRQNDGVSVIRACGVGGGSLAYSNITIRPPNFIFESNDWPLTWTNPERDGLFDLARNGIGRGILWALEQPGQNLVHPRARRAPGGIREHRSEQHQYAHARTGSALDHTSRSQQQPGTKADSTAAESSTPGAAGREQRFYGLTGGGFFRVRFRSSRRNSARWIWPSMTTIPRIPTINMLAETPRTTVKGKAVAMWVVCLVRGTRSTSS